jgi:hypothetical protein
MRIKEKKQAKQRGGDRRTASRCGADARTRLIVLVVADDIVPAAQIATHPFVCIPHASAHSALGHWHLDAMSDAPVVDAEAAVLSESELAAAEAYLGKENFVKMHKTQFMAMKLPANLMNVRTRRDADALRSVNKGAHSACKREERHFSMRDASRC